MKWMKWTLGGVMAVAIAGAVAFGVTNVVGTAHADDPEKSAQRSEYESLLAQKLGVSVETLQAAQKAARDQMIDNAVANGRITQAQADKLKAMPAIGPAVFGKIGGVVRVAAAQDVMQAAADTLGMSKTDLVAQLGQGKSLAQVAAAQNPPVSRDALKTGITDGVKAQLAKAVTAGTLTQAQADAALTELNSHLDQIVDGTKGALRQRIEEKRPDLPRPLRPMQRQ